MDDPNHKTQVTGKEKMIITGIVTVLMIIAFFILHSWANQPTDESSNTESAKTTDSSSDLNYTVQKTYTKDKILIVHMTGGSSDIDNSGKDLFVQNFSNDAAQLINQYKSSLDKGILVYNTTKIDGVSENTIGVYMSNDDAQSLNSDFIDDVDSDSGYLYKNATSYVFNEDILRGLDKDMIDHLPISQSSQIIDYLLK
jgi:hypothetical protein